MFLFLQDFKIFGYIPAWIASKSHVGMFEDGVVLTWTNDELKTEGIKLLPEGFELLELINTNNNNSQEPLVLPEIEKIINPTRIEIV